MEFDKILSHSNSLTPYPRVYIIILNWNGWKDTIECLESILKSNCMNYCIVVIDNGSTDDSCKRIQAWAKGDLVDEAPFKERCVEDKPIRVVLYNKEIAEDGGIAKIEQEFLLLPADKRMVLIQCDENLGFAEGCNVGIRYALALGSEYVWLLNNDTVVESSALKRLIIFMEKHPTFQGVTGQIRLYNNPSVVWNCGGTLTFYGARRYHYSNSRTDVVPQHGFRKISFITGCAPFFRASLFKKVGLLSNLFFYGEEDFELSHRLKRSGSKLACLYDAVLYHKVGSSINNATSGQIMTKAYIYYLNRFINMRHYWPELPWRMWRHCYFLYIFPLMKLKHGNSWKELWKFRKHLLKESSNLDRVSKDKFEDILKFGFGNDKIRP